MRRFSVLAVVVMLAVALFVPRMPQAHALVPCADLRVGSFTISPTQPVQGVPATVSIRVDNVGSCATPAFVVQWQRDQFDSTGPNQLVPGIAANSSANVTFQYTFTTAGNFTTQVQLDTQNAVLETNEANNLEILPVTVLPATIDLLATNITMTPNPAVQGLGAQIAVTVKNAGNIATPTAFLVQMTPGLFMTPLTQQVNSLAAGASTVVTFQQIYSSPGTYTISATADSSNTIAESNELNNTLTQAVNVVPAFTDLVVSSVTTSPNPLVQGRASTINATVQNLGNFPAGPFVLRVKPWVFGPDLTALIPSLAPGASVTQSFSYVFPFAGNFTIDALADSTGIVAESNEFNNDTQLNIVVEPPLPDLQITNVTFSPPSPVPGVPMTANVTVANTGNDVAGPSVLNWRPSWLLGPDLNVQIPGLAVGANITVPIGYTYPFAGDWIWTGIFTADATNAVAEVNENNNMFLAPVTVQAPFVDLVAVDLQVTPPSLDQDLPATALITIRNDGNIRSGPFNVDWKPSPTLPDRIVTVAGLDAGQTQVLSIQQTYGASGSQVETTVTVDSNNQVVESNKTNNTLTRFINVNAVGPDLTITDLRVVGQGPSFDTATQGVPVQVQATIANQGNRAAGPFEFEWNPEVPFGTFTQGPGTISTQIQGLAAGASTVYTFNYVYPDQGNFRSVADVDAFNQVPETNEANNQRILNFQVAPGIDLTITNFTVTPANVVAGAPAQANITIKNQGFFPARNFSVAWNPSGTVVNIFSPSQTIAELLPGQTATIALTSSYLFPGTYTSGAMVDSNNSVVESNENNNTATTSVTVVAH
jgi:subtilase family serine protease